MKILFSPTKKQNPKKILNSSFSEPLFKKESQYLHSLMQSFSKEEIMKKMKISAALAHASYSSYQSVTQENFTHAISLFSGTSFDQLSLSQYTNENLEFAQKHLLIGSGLYGLLRPLDAVFPYRLDLDDTVLNILLPEKKLEKYWENLISDLFSGEEYILNLASQEYSKLIAKRYPEKVYYVHFLTKSKSGLKSISIHNKKQRGKMLDYIILNKISEISALKKYSSDSYLFDKNMSDEYNYYFTQN